MLSFYLITDIVSNIVHLMLIKLLQNWRTNRSGHWHRIVPINKRANRVDSRISNVPKIARMSSGQNGAASCLSSYRKVTSTWQQCRNGTKINKIHPLNLYFYLYLYLYFSNMNTVFTEILISVIFLKTSLNISLREVNTNFRPTTSVGVNCQYYYILFNI